MVNIGNDEDDDPDRVGIEVEGFPIPSIPSFDDDEELVASIREVPITPLDSPLPSRAFVPNGQQQQAQAAAPLRIIIAGGGLGGLALASHCIQLGYDVHVFEQARQYKPFGGPIQIQSNALWALQQINPILYKAVESVGVITGDRLSGIKDGIRYQEGWLVKFDAATPAKRCNLPLTLAINRVVLQEIFLKYGIPSERVHTSQRVIGYTNLEDTSSDVDVDATDRGVAVHLEDGSTVYGDILIGADGIWSRIRHQMYNLPPNEIGVKFASKHAEYSGYTCYTGTCQHTPSDIDNVAYKVFLGQKQYFGCTDCGYGWQHWWAFLPDPPGTTHEATQEAMLQRLKREFHGWSPEIHDLFHNTSPKVMQRRDLYDRRPLFQRGWTNGCVTLLGDSAHPTMPNLGQGGAMAIEDAYILGVVLNGIRHTDEITQRLKLYEQRRFVRASIAQFLSRNGSDLLDGWDDLRNTPIIGPIAMKCVNIVQPLTMNYLYSANF